MLRVSLLTTVAITLIVFVMISWWVLHSQTHSGIGLKSSVISNRQHEEQTIDEIERTIEEVKQILTSIRTKQGPLLMKELSPPPAVITSIISTPIRTTAASPDRTNLPKVHAVTYASHHGRDDRFCRSVESALRHEYELVVLGWQVKWEGLSQKLQAAHTYAASIPDNDLMLFTDAFDVLYTAEAKQMVEIFVQRNYTILFAAECGCWPHIMEDKKICHDIYPKSPTPYRYLNSGTWIGYAKAAKLMLAEVIQLAGNDFRNANDQKLVADMFLAGKHGIQLDYKSEIFQSMHRTDPPDLDYCDPYPDLELSQSRRWRNKRTNTFPGVLHFNGGGKAHHLSMESQVWYKQHHYYSGAEGQSTRDMVVTVPSQQAGKLTFEGICPGYVGTMQREVQ